MPSFETFSEDDGEDPLSEGESILALEYSIASQQLGSAHMAESSEVTIKLPRSDYSCVMCNERFSSISALERHFCSVHRGVSLLFECATCGKTDPRPQSISTHAPKCRGAIPARVPAGGEWCCEACGHTSETRSGLSQHKRHNHPALHNEERIAERSWAPAQKGRKPSLWSREDEERQAVLEVKYSGQKNMNAFIAKELGNKINIQVGEKRRLPRNRSAASRTTVPSARNVEDNLAFLNDRTCLPAPTSEVGKHLPALVDAYVGTQGHNIARPLLQGLKRSEGSKGADALLVSATVELLKPLLSHYGPGKRKRHFISGQKGQEKVVRQPYRSWMGRRARKRGCYLRYQALFSGKRSRLASLILDGTDKIECQVPLAVVHETYKQGSGKPQHRLRALGSSPPSRKLSRERSLTRSSDVSRGKGFPTHDGEIAALAFADDLVMLSHSWDGMSHNIKILEKFCSLTGLSVQAKKCHGFLLTPTHDSYTVNDCSPWRIGGADLHMISPEESER
ncbi:hypothetical protein SKAU_G00414210 [Synaphobranchus kaupii]|uniref:C2H2-type domain-containing protein n=1 Tax=Synaphobranchus kaupii TaxID=118154 RepID=A0A9Q1E721_SYNKA|nr:hypothetical protein SKAU_G00414210 [Synaphobranchus kaupii]